MMTSAHPRDGGTEKSKTTRKRRIGVQELIRTALEEAEGDETRAVAQLVDQALEDVEYVREIFALAVQALNRHQRSGKRAATRHAVELSGGIRSLGTALTRPLLDFPLQDGAMLKDAYQPQVERAAVQFGHQGATMLHLSRWLQSVHAKMDGAKTVGECLDELTVRQLFDETEL